MSRRLAGGIPRALPSHRTHEGAEYGRYCRAILKRLGPLGPEAMPTLRETGLVVLDLQRVRAELETARAKGRRQEGRRLRREQARLRLTLLSLERHLVGLAGTNGHGQDLARAIAAAQKDRPHGDGR